jgi:hypothetical protein
VEDESEAEHVADGIVLGAHIFDVDHLRGHVPGGAAANEQIVWLVCELREAEIGDDAVEAALGPEDEVLGLEVAVHDAFAVHFF